MNVASKRMTLSEMRRGCRGVVCDIDGGIGMRQRLMSMGLNQGDEVEVLDAGRGTMIVCSGQTRLAVGRGMSSRIYVDICREGC